MGRPFWAQLLTSSSSARGSGRKKNYKQERRRQELRRQAYDAGRPSVFEGLKPNKDPWTLERAKRREEVLDDYFKQKEHLRKEQKRVEIDMERDLDRQKREIDRKYRLHELRESDPRLAKAQKRARKKFDLYRHKMLRKHRRAWNDRFRQLKGRRTLQYREITKDMERTSRRERGLPGEKQGPFQF